MTATYNDDDVVNRALAMSMNTVDFVLIVVEDEVKTVLTYQEFNDKNLDTSLIERVYWQGQLC